MSNLRIIGLIAGLIWLILTFRIYRGRRWKRFNFVVSFLLSIALIAACINPDLLNSLAGMLALRREHRGRILTILIFSSVGLWFLLIYTRMRFDEYRQQFDLLVRNLGQEEIKDDELASSEIIVVIPAHNEAANLKEVLQQMPIEIADKKVGVIVVDDASTDGTMQIVKEAGYLVARNKTRRGGGAALRLGYDISRKFKPDIVVTMDADGQHNPREVEKLVCPILEDKYDFVVGSRVLGKGEKSNRLRFIGIYFFNFIINSLVKTKITDCSSGFRAFRRSVLDKVCLREDQYHTSEFIIDAVKKGIRVGEVPITISKRKYGASKKGKDWSYGFNFAKTIFKSWWR